MGLRLGTARSLCRLPCTGSVWPLPAGLSGVRSLHGSAAVLKNPYYFYDLAAKQPRAAAKTLTFDPTEELKNMPSMEDRVKQVFGELGSREASKKEAELKARTIAGVRVPAKPEEPTNCCMSGCVNCVWELYKDEMEEWKGQRNEAKKALMTEAHRNDPWPADFGPEPDRSKGQAAPQVAEDDGDDDLDVGIRIFVQTEKRIKKRAALRKQKRDMPAAAPAP